MLIETYNQILSNLISSNPTYTLDEITTTLSQAITDLKSKHQIERFNDITFEEDEHVI